MRRALTIAFDASGVARMSKFLFDVRLCIVGVETPASGKLLVRNGAGQLVFSAWTGEDLGGAVSFFPGASNPQDRFTVGSVSATGSIDVSGNPEVLDITGSVSGIAPSIPGNNARTVSLSIPPDFIISPSDTVELDMSGATGVAIFTVEDEPYRSRG